MVLGVSHPHRKRPHRAGAIARAALENHRWHGEVTYVDGDGVVGEQPWIVPGGAHDYVSGCPLPTAFGSMQGTFVMSDFDNEHRFFAEIPLFHLKVDEASA